MLPSKCRWCPITARAVALILAALGLAVFPRGEAPAAERTFLDRRDGAAATSNWPTWRGPDHDSTTAAADLPLFWSETSGIAWKTPLPEWGTSTPAVWGNAVFVTTQAGRQLLLLHIDLDDGRIVWTREVGTAEVDPPPAILAPQRGKQRFHRLHNMASPSPVTDGRHVVVHFGNGDLAVYDFDGELKWRTNLQQDFGTYTIWWGHANSPVIFEDLVISACMQDSLADLQDEPAASYLVAHDIDTGKVRWHVERMTGAQAESCDAYTTPILWRRPARTELVVMGGNELDGYDPQSGRRLWYLPGLVGGRTVTGPTAAGELVFCTIGMRGALLAVRPEGEGELSKRAIAWRHASGTPDSCSPVVWDDLVFTVADNGVAKCFAAATGVVHWHERLKGGDFKASPLVAEGRVYFVAADGTCTVVSAARRFERLAENRLEAELLASPAVAGDRLLLRSRDALYCLKK